MGALLALLVAGAPRVAAAAPPDTLAPPGRVVPVLPDTAGRAAKPHAGWSEQPRFVMMRSALVPGWGQAHNHAWLKAVGVAAAESYLISALVNDDRVLNDLQDEINSIPDSLASFRTDPIQRYNARVEKYVGRQWMLAGVLAYALVDAYVDAHFRNFDLEFRHDPALPEGASADPGATTSAVRSGTTRLALRWHF